LIRIHNTQGNNISSLFAHSWKISFLTSNTLFMKIVVFQLSSLVKCSNYRTLLLSMTWRDGSSNSMHTFIFKYFVSAILFIQMTNQISWVAMVIPPSLLQFPKSVEDIWSCSDNHQQWHATNINKKRKNITRNTKINFKNKHDISWYTEWTQCFVISAAWHFYFYFYLYLFIYSNFLKYAEKKKW